MKLISLFSGGKDSCYALFEAINSNHAIVSLLTGDSQETESYLYQLPDINLTRYAAEAMNIPLVVAETKDSPKKSLSSLQTALEGIKEETGAEGLLSAVVANEEQKKDLSGVCNALKLKYETPLWKRSQEELLRTMLDHRFKIMVIGVNAKGFDENWLGRILDENALTELATLHRNFNIDISGESGQLETLVLDCPLFTKKISVRESTKQWDGVCGELKVEKVDLVKKSSE